MNTKILVIDDTRLNIKLLTEILEDEGYDVYSALPVFILASETPLIFTIFSGLFL